MRTEWNGAGDAAETWRGWLQDTAALLSVGAFAWAALSWSAIAQAVLAG